MDAKTRGEKEREVAEVIRNRAKEGETLALTKNSLAEELADDHYSESQIIDIMSDLVEDSPFRNAKLNSDIIYPTSQEEMLFEDFEVSKHIPVWLRLGFGGYVFMMILAATSELNSIIGISDTEFFVALLIGGVSSWYLGQGAVKLNRILQRQVPLIRKYRVFVYPFILVLLTSSMLVWLYATSTQAELPIEIIGGIIPTSLMAAVAFASLIKKFDWDEKSE